jgi:hypothetical protein
MPEIKERRDLQRRCLQSSILNYAVDTSGAEIVLQRWHAVDGEIQPLDQGDLLVLRLPISKPLGSLHARHGNRGDGVGNTSSVLGDRDRFRDAVLRECASPSVSQTMPQRWC